MRTSGGSDQTMSRAVEDYLEWLEPQVKPGGLPRHKDLLHCLMAKEFVWLVPNDDNRIQDALDLRSEYGVDPRSLGPVTVLEILVALSHRAAFMASTDPAQEAWEMIRNLELHRYRDPLGPRKLEQIDQVLDSLIWRNYDPDGSGGFFPLAWPQQDQRQIELWYQMCAYLEERFEH